MGKKSIERLSAHKRYELAESPGLDLQTQRLLARDLDSGVRSYLAFNECVLPEVQGSLVHDPHDEVRACLALNKATCVEFLVELADDKEERVAHFAARNKTLLASSEAPVPILLRSKKGKAAVRAARKRAGVDKETFKALRETWVGTLGELVEAAGELGRAPARAN